MPLGKPPLAQQRHTRRREPQQPQLVRHRALRLAQSLRRLLLRQAVDRDELCDGGSLLHVVQVLPLQIFDQREQRRLLLVRPHRKARHLPQTRELRRPQPPLSCDQLVAVLPAPHGQRLQNTVAPDALRQLAQRLRLKVFPRLIGIRADRVHAQIQHAPARPHSLVHDLHGVPSYRGLSRILVLILKATARKAARILSGNRENFHFPDLPIYESLRFV